MGRFGRRALRAADRVIDAGGIPLPLARSLRRRNNTAAWRP